MAVSDPHHQIRSTFPLEAAEIAKRKWSAALTSPITWAPFLPAVGAYDFLDVPGIIVTALIGAITGGLFWYWKRQGPEIERKIVEELVSESNRAQDKALADRMRSFNKRSYSAYAVNFGRFLQMKTEVERAIHGDGGELTPSKEQVENLIDSLCFGVADEFERLIELDGLLLKSVPGSRIGPIEDERGQLVERIQRAFRTLSETQTNLPVILNPAGGPSVRESRLDDVIDRLKEEADIARKVKERLESGLETGSSQTTQGDAGAAMELE